MRVRQIKIWLDEAEMDTLLMALCEARRGGKLPDSEHDNMERLYWRLLDEECDRMERSAAQ